MFDVGEPVGRSPSGHEINYPTKQACTRVLRCHSKRTKRIITENSPDLFLTVAEVGTYVYPVPSIYRTAFYARMDKFANMTCERRTRVEGVFALRPWLGSHTNFPR